MSIRAIMIHADASGDGCLYCDGRFHRLLPGDAVELFSAR
jgi:hypothetical protein